MITSNHDQIETFSGVLDSSVPANLLRKRLHMQRFSYSTADYPFKEIIESWYGVELKDLHRFLGCFDVFDQSRDQSTLAHKVFYANYRQRLKDLYENFVRDFIAPIVGVEFYYQVVPSFRIGLPGNKFVGEYHCDSKYNHQGYEINFNLGLSNYLGEASLRAEATPGGQDFTLLECPYGEIFSFDHIDCMHGSDPNQTDQTMASFDFRLALRELYFDSNAGSVNMNSKFCPGGYFSSEIVMPG